MPPEHSCLASLFASKPRAAVPGLIVAEDAVSPSEEAALLQCVDESPAQWTQRRTRISKNYGPYYYYKERDTTEGRFRYTDGVVRHTPLPPFLFHTLMPIVTRAVPQLQAFEPNQLHVAFYCAQDDGKIRMHNDNKMGELAPYIVGICLLSDCWMTFVRPRDNRKRVVKLPRYCVYVMTGESHFEWRHGILSGSTPADRVSFTLRQVRKLAVEEGARITKSHHMPSERAIEEQRAKDERRAAGETELIDVTLASLLP